MNSLRVILNPLFDCSIFKLMCIWMLQTSNVSLQYISQQQRHRVAWRALLRRGSSLDCSAAVTRLDSFFSTNVEIIIIIKFPFGHQNRRTLFWERKILFILAWQWKLSSDNSEAEFSLWMLNSDNNEGWTPITLNSQQKPQKQQRYLQQNRSTKPLLLISNITPWHLRKRKVLGKQNQYQEQIRMQQAHAMESSLSSQVSCLATSITDHPQHKHTKTYNKTDCKTWTRSRTPSKTERTRKKS